MSRLLRQLIAFVAKTLFDQEIKAVAVNPAIDVIGVI